MEKIKQIREKLGLTQEDLADELGVSRQTYAQLESGHREISLEEAVKLSGLFNISLSNLAEGKFDQAEVILEPEKKKSKLKSRDSTPQIKVDKSKVGKFKNILLYILKKVGAKPNVGETVIYKLLYFIEFDFYEKYEEQLIGATYIKNHYGPTPIEFKEIVKRMEKDKQLCAVTNKFFKYTQKKYLPLIEPNLEQLNALEIKHIDSVLEKLSDKSAKELSDYSHKDVPWITAELGEPIDYEAVFYRGNETSVREYCEEN